MALQQRTTSKFASHALHITFTHEWFRAPGFKRSVASVWVRGRLHCRAPLRARGNAFASHELGTLGASPLR